MTLLRGYLFILTLAVLLDLLLALPVMLLWNYVMVGTFGLPALTYWTALALLVLCNILFSQSIDTSTNE